MTYRVGLLQSARMEQRLVLSPQMIQAMQVLQLPALDLAERIEAELLENPLLERAEAHAATETARARREDERWNPELRERRGTAEDTERRHQALQNSPDRHHSLGESLLRSLALLELDPRQREVVEFLLFSLDARGYLPGSLAALAESSGLKGADEVEFACMLELVRHATHPALGARDLQECLLLQLGDAGLTHSLLRTLITERLEDVAANRLPHIAQATGHTLEEVGQAVELLRALDPSPGSSYGEAPGEVIRPEVVVEEVDGEFVVRLAQRHSEGLRISSDYTTLLRDTPRGDSSNHWIRQRLDSARWFLQALQQRQDTLLRIARATFARQRPFLLKGRAALQTLRMHEIAEAAGVHLSTVSRAVSGKYVQTPRGILPLRFFFTSGTALEGGVSVSQTSLKEIMRQLVEEEDPGDPFSDERLVALLFDRSGVTLARRTISKYRRGLAIPTSHQRRVY